MSIFVKIYAPTLLGLKFLFCSRTLTNAWRTKSPLLLRNTLFHFVYLRFSAKLLWRENFSLRESGSVFQVEILTNESGKTTETFLGCFLPGFVFWSGGAEGGCPAPIFFGVGENMIDLFWKFIWRPPAPTPLQKNPCFLLQTCHKIRMSLKDHFFWEVGL